MSRKNHNQNPPPVFSHKGTQRITKKKTVSKPSQLKSFGRSRNPFSKGFLVAEGKVFRLSLVFNDAIPGAGNKKLENPPMFIYNTPMNKEIKTFTLGRCNED